MSLDQVAVAFRKLLEHGESPLKELPKTFTAETFTRDILGFIPQSEAP